MREPGKTKKWQAIQTLVALVQARFGAAVASTVETAAAAASLEELRLWTRRVHYQPCWQAVLDGRPLIGVRHVGFEDLLAAAIGNPLQSWCLRAYYTSRGDDLQDTEKIRWAAPWLQENFHLVGGLVADLQYHRAAILSCESECLARGLKAAVASNWLFFTLYKPDGFATG
jgi:hypothetical protein